MIHTVDRPSLGRVVRYWAAIAATTVAATTVVGLLFVAGAMLLAVLAVPVAVAVFVAAVQATTHRASDEPRIEAHSELAEANTHLVRGRDRLGVGR